MFGGFGFPGGPLPGAPPPQYCYYYPVMPDAAGYAGGVPSAGYMPQFAVPGTACYPGGSVRWSVPGFGSGFGLPQPLPAGAMGTPPSQLLVPNYSYGAPPGSMLSYAPAAATSSPPSAVFESRDGARGFCGGGTTLVQPRADPGTNPCRVPVITTTLWL